LDVTDSISSRVLGIEVVRKLVATAACVVGRITVAKPSG